MRWLAALPIAAVLGACGDGAPAHYYVLCENKDANGWLLIDHQRDDKGYILACTYQSPDRRQAYTARCTARGCD